MFKSTLICHDIFCKHLYLAIWMRQLIRSELWCVFAQVWSVPSPCLAPPSSTSRVLALPPSTPHASWLLIWTGFIFLTRTHMWVKQAFYPFTDLLWFKNTKKGRNFIIFKQSFWLPLLVMVFTGSPIHHFLIKSKLQIKKNLCKRKYNL